MAGASLLALLDDIATVLDDVAVMSKVAAKKTAGVLGDDLALNAQQVAGVRAERELPVVWAVAKGSARNKLVLVPLALAISALAPWAVTPLLMIGGTWLCFEGFEKLAHRFLHGPEDDAAAREALDRVLLDPAVDMVAFERDKIRGAIRTDFVLSAEIIVIALGTVQHASFAHRATVVAVVAVAMTIGVYGFVAAIVKMDDVGLALLRDEAISSGARLKRAAGSGLLWLAPLVMKVLSVLGTAAMFLVGGGILLHGAPPLQASLHAVEHAARALPVLGPGAAAVLPLAASALCGILAGGVALGGHRACVALARRLRGI